MDAAAHGGMMIKEEKRTSPNGDNDEGGDRKDHEIIAKVGNKRKGIELVDMSNPSSPIQKDFFSTLQFTDFTKNNRSSMENSTSKGSSSTQKNHDDHELESAKAELGEVKEENQRLRMYLERITKDYQALRMQYHDIVQQDPKNLSPTSQPKFEEPEFISLTLGRTSSCDSKKFDHEQKTKASSPNNNGLCLGLDSKFEASKVSTCSPPNKALPIQISPENSSYEEPGEQDSAETNWRASKMAKTVASTSGDDHDEIISQQNNNNVVKKARVSVRARCETPTMNDGCQWRKYGQKIAKGNPCPRAYYRCTVAPNCPVRKQVQRCSQDMSILITTYEGTHNHALPISATAMASTTSAAATMLLSGSSTSSSVVGPSSATTTTTSNPLHGLNYYMSDNTKSKQLYFPHSSIISTSPSSIPTITLDLTSPSSSSSSFNKLSSSYLPPSRFSSPNLNFSCLESNAQQVSWTNGQLTYAPSQPYNKPIINNIKPINVHAQQPDQERNFHQLYTQKNQQPTSNTIAAATKAITSDPSFQSALAEALTSIISAGPLNLNQSGILGQNYFGQKLKWGDQFVAPGSSTYQSSTLNCGSSYLSNDKPGSSGNNNNNSQHAGSLISLLPPSCSNSLPISSSKSPSTSPSENIDHTN